ncbi:MAG: Gldg family protein [Rhodospirillales bacterium]|nr:Gldg family protein [Rhodospirillales bacterium]
MHWLQKLQGSRLAIAGLVLAAILLVAVNVLANAAFRGTQVDLTQGRLYTLSEGTRRLMTSLEDPIQLRLYFSPRLGEVAPAYGAYYTRVRELLERYASLSGGRLTLELLQPEPYSDAEDRAVADGLQGVPLNQAGELGYFGLVGTNSVDGRAVIPFFNLEREPFLEYDLTKLVHGLAVIDRPALGLIDALPNDPMGAMAGTGAPPPIRVLEQIREFFTVETIDADVPVIPPKVRTLMITDFARLSTDALHAVDRFVHDGGRVLAFADPLVESAQAFRGEDEDATKGTAEDRAKLLRTWGIDVVAGKVAGDIDAARRVSTGARGGIGSYIAWMSLGRENFDEGDPVMANIERLNVATSGIIEPVPDNALTVTPLFWTGPRSMPLDAEKLRLVPDITGLLRDFQPGGKPLSLAVRVAGNAPLAFPQGEEANEPRPLQVIVVGDADMLYDRFWLQTTDFFGQRVEVPTAGNGDFVINALENLADADALIGLRGRGTSYRPFTLVDELRRDAEAQYRSKEQELQQRLKELEQQLQGVQQRGEGPAGELMLTADDKAAIERFRGEMLSVRRDLRNVQHALQSDIDRLQQQVKFVNIAAVPIVLCGIGGVVALVGRMRRTRAKRQSRG